MEWLRPATGVNTTAGAYVTMLETRKINGNRVARSTSESGQVNVEIGGKMLASCSTKVSHVDSVSQSPSKANILPEIIGGKRKHVNGVEGTGGNDQNGCRRTAGTDLSKTSSSLEYDGFSFLPNIGGALLASGSTKIQLDFGGKLSAIGGRHELGRSKCGIVQDLGRPSAAPQSPRFSFLPIIRGTWLATGSSKIHMTSAGRDPVFPQGPTHETANTLLDIGGQLPVIDGKKLPAAGGDSRFVGRNPATGGKSGLVGSNPATGSKSGRRKPSLPPHPPPEPWRRNLVRELVASSTTQTAPTVVAYGSSQLGHMPMVEKYILDSCRWGHEDPGNGNLYRKCDALLAMRISHPFVYGVCAVCGIRWSSVPSTLAHCRPCACCGSRWRRRR